MNGWNITAPLTNVIKDISNPSVLNADFCIIISHLGKKLDYELSKISGVGLIIGGHTHHLFVNGKYINGTYIAAAGKFGEYLGSVDLLFDNKHSLKDISIEAIPIKKNNKEDVFEAIGLSLMERNVIYKSEENLDKTESIKLLSRAIEFKMQSEIVILASGILQFPFGRIITDATLHTSLSHQIKMMNIRVNKHELINIYLDLLENIDDMKRHDIGLGFRGKDIGKVIYTSEGLCGDNIQFLEKLLNKEEYNVSIMDLFYYSKYFKKIKKFPIKANSKFVIKEILRAYLVEKGI